MAAVAFLLIAGALSTFAILRSDRARPVGQLFPRVAMPVFRSEASPAGGDLATRGAPSSASPRPIPTVEPSPTASTTEPTASPTEPTGPPETSLPAESTPTGGEPGSAG
jgi:hypothetical protein